MPPVKQYLQVYSILHCGLFCAVIGVFVIRLVYGLTAFIKRKIASPHRRVFAGGMTLCVLLAFFPVLRGQGYSFVMGLFSGEMDKKSFGNEKIINFAQSYYLDEDLNGPSDIEGEDQDTDEDEE